MDMDQKPYHTSIMVHEVIQYLAPRPGGHYVDATFGAGGHTRAILDAQPTCTVIALDWDTAALELNGPALKQEYGDRLQLLWGSFGHITHLLKKAGVGKVDGIVADFGTSQFQLTQGVGFSFNVDTPLDMRMSPGHYQVTAYDIVNKASEAELTKIFYEYGQERNSRKIARTLVGYRKDQGPIKTTKELADIVTSIIPRSGRTIHPATKVFQALRIVVNDELNNIKSLLTQSVDLLLAHGCLICITFHSLEDRIVKQFLKSHSSVFHPLTRRVVTPSEEERARNPSSRSAKLRAAERIIADQS
jgi:16S rRNA (cytosine1402-N4)-methyltransferase